MKELKTLRRDIDEIDDKIISLLIKRGEIAHKIGEIKKSKDVEFYAPAREKEILLKIKKLSAGSKLPKEALEEIFREILNASRSLEHKIRVCYFGEEATFTHQAAIKNFGLNAEYIGTDTIADVFTEVEKNRADYGVVPVENSTEGAVNHTLDMFFDSDLKIVSEINLKIEQCLLAKKIIPLKSITTVYSHHQALAQVRNWLLRNLNEKVKIIETLSTAHAAKTISGLPSTKKVAAVASAAAAKIYGLQILAKGIEDIPDNYTRFLIIGKSINSHPTGSDKTSVMVSIKDRVGALHDILLAFKKYGINLTKIESRPSKKKAWDYVFFIDFIGHIENKNVRRALEAVSENARYLKILGSYPRAD